MVASAVGAAGVASSLYGASSANSSARNASKSASKAAAAELSFAMERYDDWQSVFGPIQDNLSQYYQNLSPDLVTAQGLENYELEKDTALTSLRETLAQRGISQSGVAGNLEQQVAMQSASERAKIRADAPMKVAQQQLGFLQIGLGSNPGNQVQSVLSGQAGDANQIANAASKNAGLASQAAVSSVFDWLGNNENLFKSKTPTPTPTPTSGTT